MKISYIKYFMSISVLAVISVNLTNAQVTDTIHVQRGWNLLSLPVKVDDASFRTLFPSAISDAFTYNNSYQAKDALENGEGYWVKFDTTDNFLFYGESIHQDSINVSKGWNMVGSLTFQVTVDSIYSKPNDIIISDFYEYETNGYKASDRIKSGIGYWIRTETDGKIFLTHFIPKQAYNPYPPDNSVDVDTNITISWHSNDPNGDALTYDIFFGHDNPPMTMVSSNQTDTFLTMRGLGQITMYYWKVITRNNHGESISSPVWRLTTFLNSCPGETTIVYQGKTYHTVQIGNQCWLKENLDVGMMIVDGLNQTNNDTIEKYCYDNLPSNCDIYGGLYQWDEAMEYVTTEGTQGICPLGWHVPQNGAFGALSVTVKLNANALKAVGQGEIKPGWADGRGTNTSGFSILLGGLRGLIGRFFDLSVTGIFWSSTQNAWDCGLYFKVYYDDPYCYFNNNHKTFGLSVRCLKD